MASLRVVGPEGEPVEGADVRVTIPGRDFVRSYLTDGNGYAYIGVSPIYVGSTAHVVVKKKEGWATRYAAFDWGVSFIGLDPSQKEVVLQSTNAPDPVWTLAGFLKEYTWAVGATAVLVIGAAVLVRR
jgi:hypothetical protein